jgi:6-pyruvoyltetrahydropterin/6-carboxytetrahydropterin synthase
MLSITKIFSFESAHRISTYEGACSQIHGHSYLLHVTVTGNELEEDMLLDFKILRKIVREEVIDRLDHSLILKDTETHRRDFQQIGQKILWMEYEPTAERMLLWMRDRIVPKLPLKVALESLNLYETATCYATWNR